MNRFDELLAAGRALNKEQREAALQLLLLSPQAPALIVAVREQWEGYAQSISKQTLAPHHGCLEHCAGSLHAVDGVEGLLRSTLAGAERAVEKKRRTPVHD